MPNLLTQRPLLTSKVVHVYDQNKNVMKWFRRVEKTAQNSQQAILMSYDLQSGQYINHLRDPIVQKQYGEYCQALAKVIDNLHINSLIEAGIGEATTMAQVLNYLKNKPNFSGGFDISWSRLAYARKFLHHHRKTALLFTGNYLATPLINNAVDLIYTSHSIEPNRNREKEILQELYRATKKYLVLLEPSNDLGNKATQKHIEKHKYCLNLYQHCLDLGYKVIEHRLFDCQRSPQNQTALLIVEKKEKKKTPDGNSLQTKNILACPYCHTSLVDKDDSCFCPTCLYAYPKVLGIPCLLPQNGVFASKYMNVS